VKRYHSTKKQYWRVSCELARTSRMSDPKLAVVRRYFEELFNRGKLELIDELLHPRYVNHAPSPGIPPGREGLRVVVPALRAAFPDLTYAIDDLVVGEHSVATRTTLSGTHLGDFFGLAASGRCFSVQQMTIERFEAGRIIAHHRVTDEASLLRQLTAP
jgi:steroid delta-isomerase-like uncharacterized protein